MKRIKLLLFTLLVLFTYTNVYASNKVNEINMNIFISEDGTATITEEWNAKLTEGTEGYKAYYNIGESTIYDLKAYMDGKLFTTIDEWHPDYGFDSKKYKAGINYTDEGPEICFGITSYGVHTYKLEYKVTNFVVSTTDSDMIYWNLIDKKFTSKPSKFFIKIYSSFKYDDSVPVWGYGYSGGYAYVSDGVIELTSDKGLGSDEYVVLLAHFPKGTFKTKITLDEDSKYYEDLASEGSYRNEEKDNTIYYVLGALGFATALIIIFSTIASNNKHLGNYIINFPEKKKKIPKDTLPFRNIPCDKDIYRAYVVTNTYDIGKKQTDFLGSILLKWTKDNVVTVITEEASFNRKVTKIKFNGLTGLEPDIERQLYNYMFEASIDGVLEKNEFTKWCENNYEIIFDWFNDVYNYEIPILESNKYLVRNIKGTNKMLVTDVFFEDGKRLVGLKKFFKEFTKMDEKTAIEVKAWKEYLIFAQLLGMADEVSKQFKKLYPDLITDQELDTYTTVYVFSSNCVNAASSARAKAENYNSGGGGMSFGGGGGGSFGGGGGGFR